MDLARSTLLVVADGRRARLFEERQRGGPLIEVTGRLGQLEVAPHESASAGRTHERRGLASHSGDGAPLRDRREAAFLGAVAARVAQLAKAGAYEGLVLMAPPRALGLLRRAMAKAKIGVLAAEPHERLALSPAALRMALRALRSGARL